MNFCFHAPAGELSDKLRRCAEEALRSATVNLENSPTLIWKQAITSADVVIVDITAQNPAACYLIGLADALGKPTILLSPIHESIPEIFADRPVIVHQWNFDYLRTKLQNFAAPSADTGSPALADDTPAGKFHRLFGDLLKAHGYVHRGPVEFDGPTFTVREQDMELALVQAIANRAKTLKFLIFLRGRTPPHHPSAERNR